MPERKVTTKLFALLTGKPSTVNFLASLLTVGVTLMSLIYITGLSPISTLGGNVKVRVDEDGIADCVTNV